MQLSSAVMALLLLPAAAWAPSSPSYVTRATSWTRSTPPQPCTGWARWCAGCVTRTQVRGCTALVMRGSDACFQPATPTTMRYIAATHASHRSCAQHQLVHHSCP